MNIKDNSCPGKQHLKQVKAMDPRLIAAGATKEYFICPGDKSCEKLNRAVDILKENG